MPFENTPGFAVVVGSKGEIHEASDSFLEYLGTTPAQVCEYTLHGLTHPNDLSRSTDLFAQAVASDEIYEADQRLRGFGEQYRWFRASVVPYGACRGRAKLWYVMLVDIDDRKRIDDDLNQRERDLRRNEALIAEGERLSRTGSFYWDTQSDEVLYSHEGYRIHEIEPGAKINLALLMSRMHPEDRPLLQQKIAAGRNDSGDLDYSIRLQLPSGRVSWIHTTARRFETDGGGIIYVGAVQDITDRHNAEEALSRLRTELAHVARISSLGALAASIAHEVNQPLTGIITNANTGLRTLNADPPNVAGALETVRRTLRDANRTADIIASLRAMFSKREVGREHIDLNLAVREITSLAAAELQTNRVTIQMMLDPALPAVLGDRVQLQQVILNLILNASDAMTNVDTRTRELTLTTAGQLDQTLRLTVSDSGTGIEAEHVDRIFEAFHTTKGKGMGIGLFVSRSIIDSHQGRIWVERNEPEGARFCVSLPVAHS